MSDRVSLTFQEVIEHATQFDREAYARNYGGILDDISMLLHSDTVASTLNRSAPKKSPSRTDMSANSKEAYLNPEAEPISIEVPSSKEGETRIKNLLAKGKQKGHLTYEEISSHLPEELVSACRLEQLLGMLDEMGILLVDEADLEPTAIARENDSFANDGEESPELESRKDEILERQLAERGVSRSFDDPIRMYMTQMGQIPLLTRTAEIALARKIEITRMAFRHKILQCDYCARAAVNLLQQVHDGKLSFDRTINTGVAHLTSKSTIKNTAVNRKKKRTLSLYSHLIRSKNSPTITVKNSQSTNVPTCPAQKVDKGRKKSRFTEE